jgi:cytochrome c-type biogenesis protein CcmH
MMLTFVLVAGSLAAVTAVLVLWPLMRRRDDARPASALAAAGVTFVLLLGSAGLYATFSNYSWVSGHEVAETPAAMASKLAQRLAEKPGDLDGWLMLGRSYSVLEQYPLAVRAYQRADRLANGQNVEALIGLGESMLAQDTSELGAGAGRMFERALAVEPGNPKALFYSAFAALSRGELPTARQRFEGMLALNPPDNIRPIIEQRIAEIDRLSGAAPPEAAAAGSPKISVHITLAPAMRARVPAGAVLFVAARDPKTPGPPFAAKRLAAEFPLDVELTVADAMLPSRHISDDQKLEVVARVALGGTPTATSGDPYGQVSYHVGKDGRLNIVVDRLAE